MKLKKIQRSITTLPTNNLTVTSQGRNNLYLGGNPILQF